MLLLLALYAVIGAGVLALAPQLGRRSFLLGALPMVATLGFLAARWSDVIVDRETVDESVTWVRGLELVADSRLDGFSVLMSLLIAGVGVLVMAYGSSYFGSSAAGARIAGLLVLFAGSMLGVVTADHLIWLYVAWELTSLTSYLLIGASQETPEQRTAALQALLITGAGGLTMLAGFVLIAQAAGTWSLNEILTQPPSGTSVSVGLGLVVVGILTKSAQYPFHFWLPGAMVAPTPISAYLHAATMVKAGVYLAARFAPAFAAVGIWRPVVVGIGLVTMLGGALRTLRQHDLKLLLAHSTVSQLGFMMVLAGSGLPLATEAVCLLILAHGLFKGALFLVVGVVDHECGTRDRREIPDLDEGWGWVRAVAIVSAASMAGIAPLAGFVAKESAFDAFAHGNTGELITLVGIVAGSVITFAYSARFVWTFLPGRHRSSEAEHAPSRWFVLPSLTLAVGTVILGIGVGPLLTPLVSSAASALDADAGGHDLALWHGFNLPLTLSAVTIVLGLAITLASTRVGSFQQRFAPPVRAEAGLTVTLRGLNTLARRVTGFVQPGSLPTYIAVILLVVIGTPVTALIAYGRWPDWPVVAEIPGHLFLAVVLGLAALAVATVRRRFAAVLMLGAVGYAMALLFAFHGAADLALTQFAVETLSVVIFMLVIHHLPTRFRPHRLRGASVIRILASVLVAVGVFGLAMSTTRADPSRGVSQEIVEAAEPEGGGKNVVNVILVDVRALDTLGEISVLTVAGVGVVALARVGRRGYRRERSS